MRDPQICTERLPRHVAIIMDGNGRWAESRGLRREAGHREGIESVRACVRQANDLGVEILTLYAFSLENWNRPKGEVSELMRLLEEYLENEMPEVMEKGIKIRSIGRMDRLPPSTRGAVEDAIRKTADNSNMTLVFALSYGARQEIVDAAKQLMRDAEAGKLDPERLDEKTFAAYLYASDLPDPDLLVRTGGENRVSNFLLWQIAYAEIYTTPLMWPDFRESDFLEAIEDFQSRERRFGMTSAQVSGGVSGVAGEASARAASRADEPEPEST